MTTDTLLRTPLYEAHVEAGARLVPFAGWEMPVQYEGVIAEHRAVRSSAGLFDVSHMGQVFVTGPQAASDLQRLLSNDVARLTDDGMAQYSLLTNESGGIEEDLIVYRYAADCYLLVVNAANTDADVALITAGVNASTEVRNVSDGHGMVALQGPLALDVLHDALGIDLRRMDRFHFVQEAVDGVPLTVATTGYTGERGCEILVAPEHAAWLWGRLLADQRVTPAGLGARDTLRLEVCYPLHGNDIDASTNAVEAGLGWVCGWGTGFVGETALEQVRRDGPTRRLVALTATGRGIPRAGCPIQYQGRTVGITTSGTHSPSLEVGVAMGYVEAVAAVEGTTVEIDVRGRSLPAVVAHRPLLPTHTG